MHNSMSLTSVIPLLVTHINNCAVSRERSASARPRRVPGPATSTWPEGNHAAQWTESPASAAVGVNCTGKRPHRHSPETLHPTARPGPADNTAPSGSKNFQYGSGTAASSLRHPAG